MTDVDGVDQDDGEDEAVFELADWSDTDRAKLTEKLTAGGITHEWEDGDLVVADADGDAAEDAIEAIEYPDEIPVSDEDDEEDDGGVGYELMSALFVAVDRLQHDPEDLRAGGELDVAADAVADAAPPYGVAAEVWQQVKEMAANIAEQLDEADADPDVFARDAAALRQLLSRYV